MTALVIPPEAILATIAHTYHDDRRGTNDGYNWHRATKTTPCLDCCDAHNLDRSNRGARGEYRRLLDAGVNRDTARYLAMALPVRRRAATIRALKQEAS